ncbi:MAG: DNA recombination protein RmuC [Pseudohongiella sp.]|nr:DNA recombination protein RmuC [Pseudohongiella sp.]MDP2127825.1 DNA recombination protein RmuC [Pseudohongiella sp.]
MSSILSVPTLTLVLMVALATLAGAFVSWLVCYRAYRLKSSDHQVLREQLIQAQTQLLQERRHGEDKFRTLQTDREDLKQQFQLLAADVLDEKSRRLTENNQQGLSTLLQPLQDKISSFEKKVEETYSREARERFSLEKELRNLQALNLRLSDDAVNLTRALKGDNKTQGNWGEFILSSILEASGLTEGREYETQRTLSASQPHAADEGRMSRSQPDVLIYLPDNRQVIVDAKVSLTAYERYCSAETEEDKKVFLQQHVLSLKTHIKQLSEKRYQNLPQLNSLDFVLLFMPVEPAFSLALQHDASLFNSAFDHHIVLVGPSTLLATLRTIQNIWRYEHQSRNALDIANKAGALYDKFVNFAEDMDELGKKIDTTRRSYDAAMNKLQSGRGNLVSRAENLRELGARANKQQSRERLELARQSDPDRASDPIDSDKTH